MGWCHAEVHTIMEHTKSRSEIHLDVIRNLLDDIAELTSEYGDVLKRSSYPDQFFRCVNVAKEIQRDFSYLQSRTRSEGVSFLTKTMPLLGKWYDSVLAGEEDPLLPQGFKPWEANGALDGSPKSYPLFCRMFTYVLFTGGGPDALDPDIVRAKARVIQGYRSLFYLFYKLEQPLTEAQETEALAKWMENEDQLVNFDYPDYYSRDLTLGREILSTLCGRDSRMFTNICPKHGTGAVAGGESNEEKWKTFRFIPTLHKVYPWTKVFWPNFASSHPHLRSALDVLNPLGLRLAQNWGTGHEATSRLLFVPKDSRGPRTISCEPKELMFVQQGVRQGLEFRLWFASDRRINFWDQTINGRLALASSKSGEFATVDLKDASDRVSWLLVKLLFPQWTHQYLEATRSTSTQLPDGSVVKHCKYAPMGSALCFPIESALFWALGVVAAVNSGYSLEAAKADTYVFGDDIICRPDCFPKLVEVFASVGLIVNQSKSYAVGPFRESCGVDAWRGFDITPFKVKKDFVSRSLDGLLAAAVCEYSSRCFALNYRRTGQYLYHLVNNRYKGVIRIPEGSIGCLHVVDPLAWYRPQGLCHGYDRQRCYCWLYGWVLETPTKSTELTGPSRLLKNLHGWWAEHDPGEVVVPRATKIRKRRILVEKWPWLADEPVMA